MTHDLNGVAAVLPVGCDDEMLSLAIVDSDRPVIDGLIAFSHASAVLDGRWPPRRAVFAALLSTRQAYKSLISPAVAARLVAGGYLDSDDTGSAEVAINEGLANAVIHGGLELPGLMRYGGDMESYYEAIQARLAGEHGLRPVAIVCRRVGSMLVVHIEDSGRGYDPGTAAAPHGSPTRSGNGWPLMRAFSRRLRVSRGGRRLSIGLAITGSA